MEVMLGKIYLDKVKDTLQQVHDQYANPFNNKRDDIEGHNFLEIVEIRGLTISYSSYRKKRRTRGRRSS